MRDRKFLFVCKQRVIEVESVNLPSLFFMKFVLGILGHLHFHMNFRVIYPFL